MSLTICLTTEQVERRLAQLGLTCPFTQNERENFAAAPTLDVAGRVFGFPIPSDNSALSLSKIRTAAGIDPSRQPSFFDHPWYYEEAFMHTTCSPGWHLLHMDVLPESIGQPSDYTRRLMSSGLEPAYAVEVVLMLFLHYLGTGEQLLSRKHSWCADRASSDRVVTVGAFGRNGVFLSAHPPGFGSRGLGVCPKVAAFQ